MCDGERATEGHVHIGRGGAADWFCVIHIGVQGSVSRRSGDIEPNLNTVATVSCTDDLSDNLTYVSVTSAHASVKAVRRTWESV